MNTPHKNSNAIYRGMIRHRRYAEKPHVFSIPITYFLVDLDDTEVFFKTQPWLSYEKFGLLSFKRKHYFNANKNKNLKSAVLDEVQNKTGLRPSGKVLMLTQLETLGLCFNPVTFYYCFNQDNHSLEAVLSEITNTPWGEKHAYVQSHKTHRFQKVFHVSPFLSMDYDYLWSFTKPDNTLTIHMENLPQKKNETNITAQKTAFDATLSLKKHDWTPQETLKTILFYPLQSLKILFYIYLHAAALLLKRVTFFTHPKKIKSTSGAKL